MVFRLLFLALVVVPFTLAGLPIQLLLLALRRPEWTVLPRIFFKLTAFALGLRIKIVGAPARNGPALIVANHISWLDIPAIAAKFPVCFVAKSEIATWPIIGALARLQKTVFVDRTRRTDAGRTAGEMKDRIAEGANVLLFAEGTSDIGTHVLPFRSALLGAARQAMAEGTGHEVVIQPMAIAYTALSGLPLSRHERPKIAWIGDMGLGDNLRQILSSGPKDVTIAFGDPIKGDGDRKTIARTAEREVRRMLVALNRGQPLQ
ncbi:lysophospholipid acyltransferase family protein [Pelagibacterium xiamenense]|uniref:lysophospholipid acyltransferase family protein n=1 Tax=Pelagibacterium xiamenense TaxID=2901140 RepID=UPI001E37BFE9|nr:lysophospholipid acyltransferase family protein [Pelagibacterium xiamenense]MCD7058512.1 1-acyl-sn-glycerol-3-phosphate acyltransferase [Pelagibacterium xiamenense]